MDFSETIDQRLLKNIQAGDVLAFNELFKMYSRFLKIEAYYRLRDLQLAEEAVQDVLISIWQRREHLEINVPLKIYLFQAIKKQCAYKERGLKLQKRMVNHVETIDTEFGYFTPTLENKELGQKIYQAIANISAPVNRKAFEMQFIDHIPQKDIAKKLNISISAVKKRISRAAQEVRSRLKENH